MLANSGLRLRAIIIGQEADKPWITNRGLDYIGLIKGLQHLALRNCHSVTNKGVAALSSLVNLYSLELQGCKKLTAKGLEFLQNMARLTALSLHNCTRITERGVVYLQSLPSLEVLMLGGVRLNDRGLSEVAKLHSLRELQMCG